MTAYRRAADLGFSVFQVDIVAVADDELLSMHAVVGRKLALERGSLAAARDRAGSDVPTLTELFAAFPDARWNIELKSTRCEAPLTAMLAAHPRRDLLCISAPFHTRVLRRLRARFDDLATNASLLEGALTGFNLLPRCRDRAGDGVQLMARFASASVIRWNLRRGRVVHAWTVNDPVRAQTLVGRGVTGLVIDDFAAVSTAVDSATPPP